MINSEVKRKNKKDFKKRLKTKNNRKRKIMTE